MFEQERRFITQQIDNKLPIELILLLWNMIDEMNIKKDYLQVFRITKEDNHIHVIHSQECPQYLDEVDLHIEININYALKIYVIDDGTHATMLLADEY